MKPVLEVLSSGAAYLERRGVDEARLNMEHLLAHVLECRRMDLYLRFDQPVPEQDLERLRPLLKRRGEGEPLQHLLGTVEFCGHELVCDHRALIPRPETETLVEHLLTRFGKQPPSSVLDVCTGSGCIGIALAMAWPQAQMVLADLSEDALELARLNVERTGLSGRVRLVRSDLLEKVTGMFDLIVANPPYIPSAELKELAREVRRDPALALDGGPTGLEVPLRLAEEALAHLPPTGVLAMELGHDQGERAADWLRQRGFGRVELHKDLAQIPRFIIATDCPSTPEAASPALSEPAPET